MAYLRLIFALLIAGFACETFAGRVTLQPASNLPVVYQGGGIYTRPGTDMIPWTNNALKGYMEANVAGVTMKTFGTYAAAAEVGAAAMQFVKGGGWVGLGLMGLAWLTQAGLEKVGNELKANASAGDLGTCTHQTSIQNVTLSQCASHITSSLAQTYNNVTYAGYTESTGVLAHTVTHKADGSQPFTANWGTWFRNGQATQGSTAPTDADWARLQNTPMNDAVLEELRKLGAKLPLNKPVIDTTPQVIPLSDPYKNPLTGDRVRDVANFTPFPDGTAKVEVTKQVVDENGNPVVNSGGQAVPQEEQKDLCEKNPDASACASLDDVPDADLKHREINLSINPLSGFGASSAQCPASQFLFSKGGQAVSWDWSKFCTFSLGIRPLVLGFAWLAAIMIVVGVARKET